MPDVLLPKRRADLALFREPGTIGMQRAIVSHYLSGSGSPVLGSVHLNAKRLTFERVIVYDDPNIWMRSPPRKLSGSPQGLATRLAAFRLELQEIGYREGRKVAIEYRWAEGKDDR